MTLLFAVRALILRLAAIRCALFRAVAGLEIDHEKISAMDR
jgi:hypothetical protein